MQHKRARSDAVCKTRTRWAGDPCGHRPDDVVLDLRSVTSDITGEFLASDIGPDSVVRRARDSGELAVIEADEAAAMRRGAPIARPGKVVCIGLNYRDHAAETGAEIPDRADRVHEGPR